MNNPGTWQRKRKARDGGERMPVIKEILDHYWQETERLHRCRPGMNWAREGAIVKRILKAGADVNALKNHITRSVQMARRGETRLALVNIFAAFQAGMTTGAQPSQVRGGIPVAEIVGYLNEKAGSKYKHTDPATVRLIEQRWAEGHCHEDFITVIDNMVTKWGRDAKMMNFLRPATLFSEKFGNYLGAKITPVDEGFLTPNGYKSALVIESWAERKRRELERSDIPFEEIISCFNGKTGCRFNSSDPAIKEVIELRWSEGRRLEDFEKVIDNMTAKWGRDPKMSGFLRPSTIFGEKMGEYMGILITPVDLGTVSAAGYQAHLAGEEWLRMEEERDRQEEEEMMRATHHHRSRGQARTIQQGGNET